MKGLIAGIYWAAAMLMVTGWAGAATLSWSADAPIVDEADIANFAGATNDAVNVNGGGDDGTYLANGRPAVGQTFTTGGNPDGYVLQAITLQHVQYTSDTSHWSVDPPWTPKFEIKIGTKDGAASFAELTTEYAAMAESGNADLDERGGHSGSGTGWYLTWTLGQPLRLEPNTIYAFSVGIQEGPFIEVTGDGTTSTNYAGGEAFGVKDSAVTNYTGDYVFHLDMNTDVEDVWDRTLPDNWSDDFLYFVGKGSEPGVAFLMESPKGGVWLVSCCSAFRGADDYWITNGRGENISVSGQVLVAKNSDLILFRTGRSAGLPCAENCGFEEKLLTFSQGLDNGEDDAIRELNEEKKSAEESKGNIEEILRDWDKYASYRQKWTHEEVEEALDDVTERLVEIDEEIEQYRDDKAARMKATTGGISLKKGFLLDGQAVALGADRIEISAPITGHDSGGPVINRNGEVVGISSHTIERSSLPEWVTEGTRFEDSRRFALKIDGVEWMPLPFEEYQKQTRYVQENYDALAAFADIIEQLDDGYFRRVRVNTDCRDIERWVEAHNEMLSGSRSEREIEKDFDAYVRMVRRLGNDAGRTDKVTIPLYEDELTALSTMYQTIYKHLKEVAREL